jgi:general secretion pathway protein C
VAPDALLKKYFTLVVLGLVALAAYFQAAGVTQLVGAALASKEALTASAAAPPPAADASGQQQTSKRTSAEPILSRNPFDSVTGPLNATPVDVPEATPRLDLSDPLAAPGCEGVQVAIITESNDPVWSVAALKGPSDTQPRLRRVGDDIGGKQVAYIGFNAREGSPAVWLTSGGTLCQALLFKTLASAPAPAAEPAPAAAAPVEEPPKSKRGPSPVPPDIAAKIQRVSESEFNIDRSVVDKILENQAELMRSARIVPEQKDGKVVGIRLFGIRPDTLLGTLGLENGDRLETINGFDMGSPEKALEAYARLRTAGNLNVKVNRRGKPLSIDFNIK